MRWRAGDSAAYSVLAASALYFEKRKVLPELGIEAGDLGQQVVIGVAPGGCRWTECR